MDCSETSDANQDKMHLIIENGRFNIPLFHATSTAFLPSILEFGLGGVDITVNYRALELFETLLHLIEIHLPDYGESCVAQMKLILQQKKGTQWRHGGAFLTPSIDRAVKYAVNPYGSELLSIIHGMNEDVIKYIPGTDGIIDEFEEIKQIFAVEHRPLLLVVDDVEIKNIQGEDGNEAWKSLQQLYKLMSGSNFSSDSRNILGQQTNFQVVEPIEIQIDSCFEIIYHKRDKLSPKYELQELYYADGPQNIIEGQTIFLN